MGNDKIAEALRVRKTRPKGWSCPPTTEEPTLPDSGFGPEDQDQQQETPLYGAIVVMLQAVMQRGGIPHLTHQPELDVATRRPVWKHYPVSFVS
jgi:hypothetical protein